MPVTLTALGDTLDVALIDTNFSSLQELFRSGLVRADFTGNFTRYHIHRHIGGRLVSATTFANPLLLRQMSTELGWLDLNYKYGTDAFESGGPDLLMVNDQKIDEDADDWSGLEMEFLGKPGPSLYYQWQEDGLTEVTSGLSTVANWPPSYWPIDRFPAGQCFSYWLTVPGASKKIWVEEPCVARIHAMGKGSLNWKQVKELTENFQYEFLGGVPNKREMHLAQLGLFVDTNPVLYSDEFQNTNPNIVTPGTSTTAPYVSWKKVRDQTYYCPQRSLFKLAGEVALRGRRWYNFSYKYRDGGIKGCILEDSAGTRTWYPGHWKPVPGYVRDPAFSLGWNNLFTLFNSHLSSTDPPFPQPHLVALWESSAIHVEFYYGRQTAYSTDSAAAEFVTKPNW